MDLLNRTLVVASVIGRLQGVISGIIKYNSDEISPGIKQLLERELKISVEELEKLKKNNTLH